MRTNRSHQTVMDGTRIQRNILQSHWRQQQKNEIDKKLTLCISLYFFYILPGSSSYSSASSSSSSILRLDVIIDWCLAAG